MWTSLFVISLLFVFAAVVASLSLTECGWPQPGLDSRHTNWLTTSGCSFPEKQPTVLKSLEFDMFNGESTKPVTNGNDLFIMIMSNLSSSSESKGTLFKVGLRDFTATTIAEYSGMWLDVFDPPKLYLSADGSIVVLRYANRLSGPAKILAYSTTGDCKPLWMVDTEQVEQRKLLYADFVYDAQNSPATFWLQNWDYMSLRNISTGAAIQPLQKLRLASEKLTIGRPRLLFNDTFVFKASYSYSSFDVDRGFMSLWARNATQRWWMNFGNYMDSMNALSVDGQVMYGSYNITPGDQARLSALRVRDNATLWQRPVETGACGICIDADSFVLQTWNAVTKYHAATGAVLWWVPRPAWYSSAALRQDTCIRCAGNIAVSGWRDDQDEISASKLMAIDITTGKVVWEVTGPRDESYDRANDAVPLSDATRFVALFYEDHEATDVRKANLRLYGTQ